MWERFNERTRRVILRAQQQGVRTKCWCIDPQHLFLSLLEDDKSLAVITLQKMGIPLQEVRQQVEAELHPSPDQIYREPQLTPDAKKVLEFSAKEARLLKHTSISSLHLLIGLMQEEDGTVARVLRDWEVTPETIHKIFSDHLNSKQSATEDRGDKKVE